MGVFITPALPITAGYGFYFSGCPWHVSGDDVVDELHVVA
jgi:hypothetical protein